MSATSVAGVLNCSFKKMLKPTCCTCWIDEVVGPKVPWSRILAAAVDVTGTGGVSPPLLPAQPAQPVSRKQRQPATAYPQPRRKAREITVPPPQALTPLQIHSV